MNNQGLPPMEKDAAMAFFGRLAVSELVVSFWTGWGTRIGSAGIEIAGRSALVPLATAWVAATVAVDKFDDRATKLNILTD